jgi:hypothetical protein
MATSYDDATQAPTVKASRLRLYDVIGTEPSGDHRLRNKEGLVFTAPADDVLLLGEVRTRREVTPTEMAEVLEKLKGWFHISFIKAKGEVRHMYAHVHGRPIGGLMPLQDLERPNSETRNCRMERVFSVITGGTQHVLKKPAFRKLTSA